MNTTMMTLVLQGPPHSLHSLKGLPAGIGNPGQSLWLVWGFHWLSTRERASDNLPYILWHRGRHSGKLRLPKEKLERLGALLKAWGDKKAWHAERPGVPDRPLQSCLQSHMARLLLSQTHDRPSPRLAGTTETHKLQSA